jgi:hypothetical protein
LVGKPKGKRPPERPQCRWEDNIKIVHRKIGCGDVDLIDLAQDIEQWQGFVSTVMNLWVPYIVGKFLNSWAAVSFSRSALLHGVGWLVNVYIQSYPELWLFKLWRLWLTDILNCHISPELQGLLRSSSLALPPNGFQLLVSLSSVCFQTQFTLHLFVLLCYTL